MGTSWKGRIAALSSHLLGAAAHSEAQGSITISQEVQQALAAKQPVVALESTIISHGMPYPQNLHTARQVEATVREHGAVPATIAILAGVPHVGLSDAQLEFVAANAADVRKTSRRDLPAVVAQRLHGATTVSATMLLAARAGIPLFVTGGIGGVHRGGESTMDVSADLTELGRTPVAVVCAGVKSLLDIPRTLEVLETQGVCVAAYGADEFPAFFTPRSGCNAACRVDSPADAAALVDASLRLGLGSGILIGVPIPDELSELGERGERAIQTALHEAEQQGIRGNAITPWLLQRVQQLTGGASLRTNINLIKHNAAVGAQIAVALASRQKT